MPDDHAGLPPGEKLIVIPDIHNKHDVAEEIIQKEAPDMVVFLGDYFDDFGETLGATDDTARWLAKSLLQGNRVHLIGNHDLSYMTGNPNLKCTGYSPAKHAIIESRGIAWTRLRPYFWVDDWLFTHAGFSNKFYKLCNAGGSMSVREALALSMRDLEDLDDAGRTRPFFQAGFLRGGTSPVGGLLWCDYGEFEDIPHVRQVFGHTRDSMIRHQKTADSEHYCIDTQLSHYAVYRSESMAVKSVA